MRMTTNAHRLELGGEEIDEVGNFGYLGNNISKDGGSDRDIQLRIGKARTAFIIVSPVWKSQRMFHTNVKAVLLSGSESWSVTKAASDKLQSFVNKYLKTSDVSPLPASVLLLAF